MCRNRHNPIFLSTPSARRATMSTPSSIFTPPYFYPRPPRGGRPPLTPFVTPLTTYFYPRPPRGGRRQHIERCSGVGQFLSTPSARRATAAVFLLLRYYVYFYPRPPRGGRPLPEPQGGRHQLHFYPRPPRGGRRYIVFQRGCPFWISIHALREEGDLNRRWKFSSSGKFLSTPSARRATC